MTPTRPYLLRALYEWILDNDLTPHVLVSVESDEIEVPSQYVEDDRIVLNINPAAVRDLSIANDYLSFNARFDGRAENILVPISSVIAIYAKENGEGMAFPDEVHDDELPESEEQEQPGTSKGRPELKVVK